MTKKDGKQKSMPSVTFRVAATLMLATIMSCSSGTEEVSFTPTKNTATEAKITVTDTTNTTIGLEEPAERIVCLNYQCLDILAELGMKPVAIAEGLAFWASEPHLLGDSVASIPKIAGIAAGPNVEQIVKLKPDLVIGLSYLHSKSRDILKGVVPFYLLWPQSYSEAIAELKNVGKLTGKTAEAEAAAQRFLDKLADYKAKSPGDRRVMLIHRPPPNFAVATDKSLNCSTVMEVAKCVSPEYNDVIPLGYVPLSLEQLVKIDPEAIFIPSGVEGYVEFSDYYDDNPLWQGLTAVKTGQVYGADGRLWLAYGTRGLSRMLDEMMPKIYPDVFAESQS